MIIDDNQSNSSKKEVGGEIMGMTDRQFDAYQEIQLRELKRAEEEVEELTGGKKSKVLEQIIASIEKQLQRP